VIIATGYDLFPCPGNMFSDVQVLFLPLLNASRTKSKLSGISAIKAGYGEKVPFFHKEEINC